MGWFEATAAGWRKASRRPLHVFETYFSHYFVFLLRRTSFLCMGVKRFFNNFRRRNRFFAMYALYFIIKLVLWEIHMLLNANKSK